MKAHLFIIVLSLTLVGCGFHLRTWDLDESIETARITANLRNPLAEPLERALRGAGVELVTASGRADVVIELLNDQRGRRSVSVTDRARAAEYESSLSVQFAIKDRNGDVGKTSRELQLEQRL